MPKLVTFGVWPFRGPAGAVPSEPYGLFPIATELKINGN